MTENCCSLFIAYRQTLTLPNSRGFSVIYRYSLNTAIKCLHLSIHYWKYYLLAHKHRIDPPRWSDVGQSCHLLLGHTVMASISRWLQFANNRYSIQSLFWDQWFMCECVCVVVRAYRVCVCACAWATGHVYEHVPKHGHDMCVCGWMYSSYERVR